MKELLKAIIGENVLLQYHRLVAFLAAVYYRFPSRRMVIIGVTGTKGKTTTSNLIWSVLQRNNIKTGIITTTNIRIGDEESMNHHHMSMPGRFKIQRYLRQMVKAGCWVAVVETTSEGLKQYRHTGIFYDIGVFTNLTPEHLQSHHNSFDEYRETKARMFAAIARRPKKIRGVEIEKVIFANADSEFADYYLSFGADTKKTFGIESRADLMATDITSDETGVSFLSGGEDYHLSIPGEFNVINALPAIGIGLHMGLAPAQIAQGLDSVSLIPGRMEVIEEGQPYKVIVDYAHEKESMSRVLAAGRSMAGATGRVIVLLGAEGGGRDTAKRAHMGELAGKLADYVIVSNVDPYEDDPTKIAEDIAVVSEQFGKVRDKDLYVIKDRRAGIAKCFDLAQPGDIVLITGKGAEQSITIGGVVEPWDDRDVVREELRKIV